MMVVLEKYVKSYDVVIGLVVFVVFIKDIVLFKVVVVYEKVELMGLVLIGMDMLVVYMLICID